MYNIDEIKELIALLEESSLRVLEVQAGENRVRLEKAESAAQAVQPAPAGQPVASAIQQPQTEPAVVKAERGKTINAPIVGVFYSAPSPSAEPYVLPGRKVRKGDTVCIIEAMKCMNEIQAEEDGEITDVLVKNGDLVEFDQPLFSVK